MLKLLREAFSVFEVFLLAHRVLAPILQLSKEYLPWETSGRHPGHTDGPFELCFHQVRGNARHVSTSEDFRFWDSVLPLILNSFLTQLR